MEHGEVVSIGHAVLDVYKRLEQSRESTSKRETTALRPALNDAFERYCLWAGNLGAFHAQHDTRSLDHRLRNAPSVARRIWELLSELNDLLETAQSAPLQALAEISGAAATINGADSDDEDLLRELAGVTTSQEAKDSWVSSGISDTITRLFKMSAVLAKSTVTDRYTKAEASTRAKFNPSFDIAHVREKFKGCHADDWLIERLGKAVTKRRQYLGYCQSHREKLAQPPRLRHTVRAPTKYEASSTSKWDSTPKSEHTRPSANHTAASSLGPVNLDAIDDGFDDNRSYSTMATSIGGSEAYKLKVPSLSDFASLGEPFECPYCRTMQKFNGQLSWRKHVFADIRPYLCTFQDCGMLMFDSKRIWAEHELQNHRRVWICRSCRRDDFCDAEAIEEHIRHAHGAKTSGKDNQTKTLADSRPAEVLLAADCLLCNWDTALRSRNAHIAPDSKVTVTARQFMNHLAKHLEQLALFALPKGFSNESNANSAEAARAKSLRSSQELSDDDSTQASDSSIVENASQTNGLDGNELPKQLVTNEHFAELLSNSLQQNENEKAVSWLLNTKAAQESSPVGESFDLDRSMKGICPIKTCAQHVRDLKSHMLTHQSERPEKCPISTCTYHSRGFARAYDRDRHLLTHFSGTLVCGLCPGVGTSAEKSFNRVDVFKRHLVSIHGVQPPAPSSSYSTIFSVGMRKEDPALCSTCGLILPSAQYLYRHVDDCVLGLVRRAWNDEIANDWRLTNVTNDVKPLEDMERHMVASEAQGNTSADPAPTEPSDASAASRAKAERLSLPHSNSSGSSTGQEKAELGTPVPESPDETSLQSSESPELDSDELALIAVRAGHVIHHLAVKPMSMEEITVKTDIPPNDLKPVLERVGTRIFEKWCLKDLGYENLDVWEYNYCSQSDRQDAIDNATKEYDRMNIGKGDELWQKLLPYEERHTSVLRSTATENRSADDTALNDETNDNRRTYSEERARLYDGIEWVTNDELDWDNQLRRRSLSGDEIGELVNVTHPEETNENKENDLRTHDSTPQHAIISNSVDKEDLSHADWKLPAINSSTEPVTGTSLYSILDDPDSLPYQHFEATSFETPPKTGDIQREMNEDAYLIHLRQVEELSWPAIALRLNHEKGTQFTPEYLEHRYWKLCSSIDERPSVRILSKGEMQILSSMDEPNRMISWLRMCFEEDTDSEIHGTALCKAYEQTCQEQGWHYPISSDLELAEIVRIAFEGLSCASLEDLGIVFSGLRAKDVIAPATEKSPERDLYIPLSIERGMDSIDPNPILPSPAPALFWNPALWKAASTTDTPTFGAPEASKTYASDITAPVDFDTEYRPHSVTFPPGYSKQQFDNVTPALRRPGTKTSKSFLIGRKKNPAQDTARQ